MIEDELAYYAREKIMVVFGNEIPVCFDSNRNNATTKHVSKSSELS